MDFSNVKGTKDYSFEEAIALKDFIDKIEEIYKRYGFNPIITPIVEYYDVLANKYGEEGEKLMWRFKLPYSEKEYGLKYDQTVPLQRYIAMHRPKLPFKRYQIDRAFRYDDPQHGRYREFIQADIDIVGSSGFLADVEIIDALADALHSIGFNQLKIRIFDRRLWSKKLESLGLSSHFKQILSIIDKLDKVPISVVASELRKIIGDKAEEILDFLNNKEYQSFEEFDYISKILSTIKHKTEATIDPSVVRGLEYYSSTVFEITDGTRSISLAGGGRYDGFIFVGSTKLPAVGGSIGVSRVFDVARELGLISLQQKSYSNISMFFLDESAIDYAYYVASKIRELGYYLFLIDEPVNVLDGIEICSKLGLSYVLIIGKKEKDSNTLVVHNLNSKVNEVIKLDEIESWLHSTLGRKEKS
jgi:histidyl-tRNA synthetase